MRGMFFKGALVGGIGAALVMAATVAVAATGGNFLLGKSNSAGAPTSLTSTTAAGSTLKLTNTGGKPAASFTGGTGAAPFTVNSTKNVAKLNADLLDGIDSTQLVRGKGQTYALAVAIPRSQFFNSTEYVPSPAVSPGFFNVSMLCPGLSSSNRPNLKFYNLSGNYENLFWTNGNASSTFAVSLAPGGAFPVNTDFVDLTTATIQGGPVATVQVSTLERDTDCHFQIQALITNQ